MTLDDVGGCWMMLGDVGGCWRMLDDVGGCWRMLDDVGECWVMLEDVGFSLNLLKFSFNIVQHCVTREFLAGLNSSQTSSNIFQYGVQTKPTSCNIVGPLNDVANIFQPHITWCSNTAGTLQRQC